jgi:hypothetical protein
MSSTNDNCVACLGEAFLKKLMMDAINIARIEGADEVTRRHVTLAALANGIDIRPNESLNDTLADEK